MRDGCIATPIRTTQYPQRRGAAYGGRGRGGNGFVLRKSVRCPFPHADGQLEKHASGDLYEKDGVWRFKCHGCGFCGDIIDVRARSTNRKPEDVLREMGESPRLQARRPPHPWAQYRDHEWQAAVESLEKSCALQSGGDEFQWFFLAMAHWQLRHEDVARAWYTASCQLQNRNDPERTNPDGRRLRDQAAALLGLPEQWPPAGWAPGDADLLVYDRLLELSPDAEWPREVRAAAKVARTESAEPPGPFNATPAAVPGLIQAEDFDRGGPGRAYVDTSLPNTGTEPAYRPTTVDLDACEDDGGGCNVGGILPGEWLAYTIVVKDDGVYDLDLRLSSPGGGGRLHLEFDGEDRTGSVVIPKTGDWNKWQTVTPSGVRLSKGRQLMKVVFDAPADRSDQSSHGDGHVCNLNWLRIHRSSSVETTMSLRYRVHKQSGQAIVTLNGRNVLHGKHGSAAKKAEYLIIDPAEIAKLKTKGEKVLSVEWFVGCDSIDPRYLTGSHYYLMSPDG